MGRAARLPAPTRFYLTRRSVGGANQSILIKGVDEGLHGVRGRASAGGVRRVRRAAESGGGSRRIITGLSSSSVTIASVNFSHCTPPRDRCTVHTRTVHTHGTRSPRAS